jgi:hypothetical protein
MVQQYDQNGGNTEKKYAIEFGEGQVESFLMWRGACIC